MKILYFDYWTVGIENFRRINQMLIDSGYTTGLLHLGSWLDSSVPQQEIIYGIKCKDISFYSNNVGRALYLEKPDILIGLNYTHTMDRVIKTYCETLGIKTIYMMHGARKIKYEKVKNGKQRTIRSIGMWGIIKRLPSYLRIMPLYLQARHSRKRAYRFYQLDLRYFKEMLLRPEKVLIEPEPHPDLQWDIAFVYSRKYKTFLVDQIGYCQDKVRIVGNPEYDEAIRIWHDTNVEEICKEYLFALNVKMNYRDKNIILWLDEALVEMNTITEDERIYELGIIAKAAAQNGYDVIVKSHPASDITMIKEFCKSRPHLHFIEKAELGILVWLSSFTIGHSSTALLLPVILGRPIYGLEKLAGREIPHQNYNSVIQTFCPEDISNIFSNPQKFYFTDSRKDQIKTFLENNVGPTDGLTVDRIIESVKVLAGNN